MRAYGTGGMVVPLPLQRFGLTAVPAAWCDKRRAHHHLHPRPVARTEHCVDTRAKSTSPMKLKAITTDIAWQAITSYLAIAYPDGVPERVVPDESLFQPTRHIYQVLQRVFVDESHTENEIRCRRYTLRLGNYIYPHMKLVLAEFLEQGQFFFFVDAHDQLPIEPGSPEYPAWMRIKWTNAAVKELVERRWEYLGVPTLKSLKEVVTRRATSRRTKRPKTILVVDDNRFIAAAVQAVLSAKGFVVHGAEDGMQALEVARKVRPDIIILDYQMPRMDGATVCGRLKEDATLAKIPIILATTTPLEFIGNHRADGFLVKPFDRRVLLSFVEHFLAKAEKARADEEARAAADDGDDDADVPTTSEDTAESSDRLPPAAPPASESSGLVAAVVGGRGPDSSKLHDSAAAPEGKSVGHESVRYQAKSKTSTPE